MSTAKFLATSKLKPTAWRSDKWAWLEGLDNSAKADLPNLVELKLASGMTNAGRLKDLADDLELIKILSLPIDFANQLDPFVQDKFGELWRAADEGQGEE